MIFVEKMEGTPAEVFEHEELLELIIPYIRADFYLVENYVNSKLFWFDHKSFVTHAFDFSFFKTRNDEKNQQSH